MFKIKSWLFIHCTVFERMRLVYINTPAIITMEIRLFQSILNVHFLCSFSLCAYFMYFILIVCQKMFKLVCFVLRFSNLSLSVKTLDHLLSVSYPVNCLFFLSYSQLGDLKWGRRFVWASQGITQRLGSLLGAVSIKKLLLFQSTVFSFHTDTDTWGFNIRSDTDINIESVHL